VSERLRVRGREGACVREGEGGREREREKEGAGRGGSCEAGPRPMSTCAAEFHAGRDSGKAWEQAQQGRGQGTQQGQCQGP